MVFGQNVRRLRYHKGWGPDRLAEAAGISKTALYQIELGQTTRPRASTAKRLADALDATVDELFGCVPDVAPFPLRADTPADIPALMEQLGIAKDESVGA